MRNARRRDFKLHQPAMSAKYAIEDDDVITDLDYVSRTRRRSDGVGAPVPDSLILIVGRTSQQDTVRFHRSRRHLFGLGRFRQGLF